MQREFRKCGGCECYVPQSKRAERGNCLIYESVAYALRKKYSSATSAKDDCRYSLAPTEEIELSTDKIAKIANRARGDFFTKVRPYAVNLNILTDWLGRKES